jgi:nitrous oxide reductase accessory protein NosL
MGRGIAAFASREAAEKLAAEFNGRVLTLDELLNGGMMEKSSH